MGIRPSDLFWAEGQSNCWRSPEEIDELVALITAAPEKAPTPKSQPVPGTIMEKKSASKADATLEHEKNSTTAVPDKIKLVIADDHALFREGVKMALQTRRDIQIIGEAETGVQLLNLLKHAEPDVLLLDIEMPVMDGLTALKEIRKTNSTLKVVILSMHNTRSMVANLMEAGANSYLTKSADSESIYQAIRGVYEKEYYFNELTNLSMLEGLRAKPKAKTEKEAKPEFDGKDLMKKMVASNRRHIHRIPKKRKRQSMLFLAASLITAMAILAAFYVHDRKLNKAIMYESPGEVVVQKQQKESTSIPMAPATSYSESINNLLKLQDSDLSRKKTETKRSSSPPPARPERRIRREQPRQETASEPAAEESKTVEPVAKEEIKDSVLIEDKASLRYKLRNQLTVQANDYKKGVFGGVYDIELTVHNKSPYLVDQVIVELQYLLSGKKVHKSELIYFKNIQPESSLTMEAPKSARGVEIKYWISAFDSRQLD